MKGVDLLYYLYGYGVKKTIYYDSEKFECLMFGNDECWNLNRFYQYIVVADKIYYAFYEVPCDIDDLGLVDYSRPYLLEEIDSEHFF